VLLGTLFTLAVLSLAGRVEHQVRRGARGAG